MRLDVRFIIPGPDGRTVLLTAAGALPSVAIEGDADEAAVIAIDRILRADLRFEAAVLETHPRSPEADDGPMPTLATTEAAPVDWRPPAGLAFGTIPAEPLDLPPVLLPRAREWFTELRTGAPPPPLRPRWARPGWNARASSWMRSAAAAAGRPLTGDPRPFFLRGISALLRAPTDGPDLFLKAVFPPFHAEPVVTRLLAEHVPETVPRVVAIEAEEGWLLVEDLAAPWVDDLSADRKPHGLRLGVRALVGLQQTLAAGDLSAFAAAGCPVRGLDGIAEGFDAALGPDGVGFVDGELSPARRVRAITAVRGSIGRVADLGFPATIVHGDFHSGNAALVGDRVVIIDWSDAAIGNPLIDLVTWLGWAADRPT